MRVETGITLALLMQAAVSANACAQRAETPRGDTSRTAQQAAMSAAAHMAMSSAITSNPHLRMTMSRPRTIADSIRAVAIADTLRRALAKYADPAAAERDGFRLFAPEVKTQKMFHYTKWGNAVAETFRFNPSKPTSLLYKPDAQGRMKLIGAMYTMPKRTSEQRLDARVPLSVAQWHQHTNLCAPPRGREDRLTELRDGKPIFGVEGSIVSKEACTAAGGRWWGTLFGWMVHANVFEGTDLATVWGHADEHEHGQHD